MGIPLAGRMGHGLSTPSRRASSTSSSRRISSQFLLSDRWQQSDGHIPCTEWQMNDECPPVYAWAVWNVYERSHDLDFLQAVYPGAAEATTTTGGHTTWSATRCSRAALLGMDNLPRAMAAHGPGRRQRLDGVLRARHGAHRVASCVTRPTSERYWVDRGTIQAAINTTLWDQTTSFYYDLNTDGSFVLAEVVLPGSCRSSRASCRRSRCRS